MQKEPDLTDISVVLLLHDSAHLHTTELFIIWMDCAAPSSYIAQRMKVTLLGCQQCGRDYIIVIGGVLVSLHGYVEMIHALFTSGKALVRGLLLGGGNSCIVSDVHPVCKF